MVVEVVGEVFRDEAIEECAENILLEVPTVDASAEVVGDLPDRLVELCSVVTCHRVYCLNPVCELQGSLA